MILETAHPVKFYDMVEPVIGEKIPLPGLIEALLNKEKKTILIKADYQHLKNYLLMGEA